MKHMKNPKHFVDCCIVTLASYLIVGIIGVITRNMAFVSMGLTIVLPIICLVCGVQTGIKNGFSLYYPLFAGIAFLPSMFLFFDKSFFPFLLAYMTSALVGVFLGYMVSKNSSSKKHPSRLK